MIIDRIGHKSFLNHFNQYMHLPKDQTKYLLKSERTGPALNVNITKQGIVHKIPCVDKVAKEPARWSWTQISLWLYVALNFLEMGNVSIPKNFVKQSYSKLSLCNKHLLWVMKTCHCIRGSRLFATSTSAVHEASRKIKFSKARKKLALESRLVYLLSMLPMSYMRTTSPKKVFN